MTKIKYGIGISLIVAVSFLVSMTGCQSSDISARLSKKHKAIIVDSDAYYMEKLAAKEKS